MWPLACLVSFLRPSDTRLQAGIIIAICVLHLTAENFFSIPGEWNISLET
jgi:hypothetical protein